MVIQVENLTKRFGPHVAVDSVSFEVEKGEIVGFLGPNGAGKTTTIRILCGLLNPTSGRAFVAGHDVVRHPREIRKIVGYLPDFFGTYDRMRVWEYLDFFGAAYRIPRRERRKRIEHALEISNAAHMRDLFMGSLSKGMKQRVGIAKTLVPDPSVLILDEPTSGLDPVARIEIRQLLKQLKLEGDRKRTIMISSHILPELAAISDEVGIIEKGRLLAFGPIKKILAEISQTRQMQMEFLEKADEAASELAKRPGVEHVKVVQNLVQFEFQGDDAQVAALLRELVEAGYSVCRTREVEADLEEVFIRVTGRDNQSAAVGQAAGSAT